MMTAQPLTPSRSSRGIAFGLALLLQLLMLSLLSYRPAPPAPARAADTRFSVRLLAERPLQPRVRATPAAPRAAQRPETPAETPTHAAPAVPAITLLRAEPVPAAAAAPSGPASAPPRLNLNLPSAPRRAAIGKPSVLNQALNDPRGNSPRTTLEDRVADAAGTLPVMTSASTDGLGDRIVRQGSKCIRVHDARITMLNPMDPRLKDVPPMVGSCN